ncbi:hypothetical protein [Sphingopyxis granuli]|jgi:hypothetical protein|uniref:hypothetical protein n=1 Tax=Sphingopyxis granuli TaxID=267128 RepID=UPI00082BFDCD|nr:hypothetical protein [Sphingopyxis granuli]
MRYGEAFAKLGYALTAPRQDWSAERDDGVCITLWRSEIDWKTLTMDSRLHGGPLSDWSGLPGNAKRIRHVKRALDEFGGAVDTIIVDGIPGQGVIGATPWNPDDRKGLRWYVTDLEEATGHIRLEVRKPQG